jgi:3-oxoadipate enol-lactonase
MGPFSVIGPVGTVVGLRLVRDDAAVPVVFVHHINGVAQQWSPVMEQITGRTSVAVDLRGHGWSQPGGCYGAPDYAADVAAALDGLGITRAHLVGASFGACVCLTLAAEAPQRVQSVTLIGGALSVADLVDPDAVAVELHTLGTVAFFEKMAALSFAPGTDDALLRDAVRLAVRKDAATAELILRAAFSADVTEAAAQVRAPALVLAGEHDHTCPPARATALAKALGTSCRVLPGRGHLSHIEDPALIADLIAEHVRRTDPVDAVRAP